MREAASVLGVMLAAFVCPAIGCSGGEPQSAKGSATEASGRVADSATVHQRLQALMDGLHQAERFDGAVVVSDARGEVFAQGYGWADAERQVPFTPETATDGASLAKTFTAALALALQAEGTLDLDAPVTRLLPELPYPGVTVRQLLAHSSGIPVRDYDFFDLDFAPGAVRTTEDLLRALAKRRAPAATAPGTAFEYSSFGYDLAALACARAGGRAYFQLLDERFLRPLGIASAFVRPGRLADFPGVRTLGYRRDAGRVVVNDVFEGEAFHGGCNIYISARDLDRWNASFLRAPRLPPAALTADLTPATLAPGAGETAPGRSGLTLGSWYRRGDDGAFWYSGHLQAFHSEVFRDVRRGWSIVSTSNNTIDPWMQKGLVRAIVRVLEGGAPIAPAIPPVEEVPVEARLGLAGRYEAPEGEALLLEAPAGGLRLVRQGVAYRVHRLAPDAFYVPGLDFVLGFAKTDPPAGWKMFVSSNVGEWWSPRLPPNP
jgi:CubicO group peptidase (beta-lactamase class C family)